VISLICSNYNSSQYIDRYLQYVNEQMLEEFELVVVDANSTDDSLQKIKDFEFRAGIRTNIIECDKRIGIYTAWNIGIERSHYDYVMNYNVDDKLFPQALAFLAAAQLDHPDIDVIYSNCYITDSEDHSTLDSIYRWVDANKIMDLMDIGCCCGPFPMLKKSSIIEAGGFDQTFPGSGDYEMWCRMCTKGYKFFKLQLQLGIYYRNPEGVSTPKTTEQKRSQHKQDFRIRTMYMPEQ
jgi:glycosyltransferase involved in cell wall biosynthesis